MVHPTFGFVLAALCGAAPDAPPAPGAVVVELRYKVYRDFPFELPAPAFAKLAGELPVRMADGKPATVRAEGSGLAVDTDGDGTTDLDLAPATDDLGVRTALCVLRPAGGVPYAVRLRDEGAGWTFAASGAVVGNVGDTRLQIVDLDDDGRYDGIGTDALVVGSGERAAFLSHVVRVGGELYALEVDPAGTRLTLTPYEGERGTLDLSTGLQTDARLLWAVVQSEDRDYSFDLAASTGPVEVPAATYRITCGKLGLGTATVEVAPGQSGPLRVEPGGTARLAWGGPTRAEFDYQRRGTQLVLDPERVWYYGAAGEQYRGWAPRGKSPEFTVKERDAGTELAKATFPGST